MRRGGEEEGEEEEEEEGEEEGRRRRKRRVLKSPPVDFTRVVKKNQILRLCHVVVRPAARLCKCPNGRSSTPPVFLNIRRFRDTHEAPHFWEEDVSNEGKIGKRKASCFTRAEFNRVILVTLAWEVGIISFLLLSCSAMGSACVYSRCAARVCSIVRCIYFFRISWQYKCAVCL